MKGQKGEEGHVVVSVFPWRKLVAFFVGREAEAKGGEGLRSESKMMKRQLGL